MSEPLSIEVTALAAAQVRTAEIWWRDNRPKAPGAIRTELERACSLIACNLRLARAPGTSRYAACADYISPAFTTISTTASSRRPDE